MTRKPDDTEPTGTPDAAIESLLDDAGAIDIRAEQASSDGLEQAHYYAEVRPAPPRAHTKTDPLSNVIVERTPMPGRDATTEVSLRIGATGPVAPPSSPRDLVATELTVATGSGRAGEPSTARKIAAVFVGAAVVALGIVVVALALRAPRPPTSETPNPPSASASVTSTIVPSPSVPAPTTSPPTPTSSAQPTASAPPRATSSARTPSAPPTPPTPPTTAASTTAPPAASSTTPPAASASARFGAWTQENPK